MSPVPAPEPTTIEEGDPFRSREGNPRARLYAPQNNPANDYINPDLQRNDEGFGYGSNPPQLRPLVYLTRETSVLQRQSTRDTRISSIEKGSSLSTEQNQATLARRLALTIKHAEDEGNKHPSKAKLHGYALNTAICLQVLFGSLTTGLSAAATVGKSAAVQTTILGGLSTLVTSYLAHARGSIEPQLSNLRIKDLDQFIRECKAFSMDHGRDTMGKSDDELKAKRKRFEELLGNASG
ncbi:hypothetical protein CPB84DRAFT_1842464 [Gymnopilus junonius]|uniref:SMODS and SLOG-associating 2TM effector domain-containing protein n=1 Tax=Gymnopilus junonius TaxID=109634 RepID=A0A9P5TTW1_GYMJU|nr:hypothetical protein CPB84DRAFT_1842464 [Gymnopilus junonius]